MAVLLPNSFVTSKPIVPVDSDQGFSGTIKASFFAGSIKPNIEKSGTIKQTVIIGQIKQSSFTGRIK